jgi:hypothetical protein
MAAYGATSPFTGALTKVVSPHLCGPPLSRRAPWGAVVDRDHRPRSDKSRRYALEDRGRMIIVGWSTRCRRRISRSVTAAPALAQWASGSAEEWWRTIVHPCGVLR